MRQRTDSLSSRLSLSSMGNRHGRRARARRALEEPWDPIDLSDDRRIPTHRSISYFPDDDNLEDPHEAYVGGNEAFEHATLGTPADSRLTDKDAWDVATQWQEALSCCHVHLVTSDLDDMKSLVSSFSWVEFDFSHLDEQSVKRKPDLYRLIRVARAAAMTWIAVSSCPGYGEQENPTFWKKVFDHHTRGTWRGSDVTDKVRFFVRCRFPRFRIKLGAHIPPDEVEGVCRAFFYPHADKTHTPRLIFTMEEIAPFMDISRWERPIDVSISFSSAQNTRSIVPRLTEVVQSIRDQISAQNEFAPNALLFARFRLYEVALLRNLVVSDDSDVDMLLSCFRESTIRLSKLTLKIDPDVSSSALSQLLKALLGVAENCPASLTSDLTLACSSMSDRTIGAVCSLLPLTHSLQTLRFTFRVQQNDTSAFQDHLWHWLNYAIHHPDTMRRSSWRILALDSPPVSSESAQILRTLIQERNAGAGGHQVRVRSGAMINEHPRETSTLLNQLKEDTLLDRYHTPPDIPDWLCVVLPGKGCGWVHRSHITENTEMVQVKPAGGSISALKWSHILGDPCKGEVTVVAMLVKLFGRRLRYLDATTFPSANADHVHQILTAAPELESLCINHDGSYWSTSGVRRRNLLPLAIQELWLYSYHETSRIISQRFFDIQLPHLRVLRLTGAKNPYATWRIVIDTLADRVKHNPRLEFVHWSHSDGSDDYQTYADAREQSRGLLGISDDTKDLNKLVRFSVPIESRLAFVSVLRHHTQRGIIPDRFDPHVLGHVFDYASSFYSRVGWIDGLRGMTNERFGVRNLAPQLG